MHPPGGSRRSVSEEMRQGIGRHGAAVESPASILAELLDRSTEQSPEEARRCAFVAILRQMVPDEARMRNAIREILPTVMFDIAMKPPR